jgi:hypothetical protein
VRILAAFLWVVVLVALAWTMLPFLLVAPFLSQTALHLRLSYALDQSAPGATLLLLLPGIVLATIIWRRGPDTRGKVGVIVGCGMLALLAFAARLIPAEIVFSRLDDVVRIPADRAEPPTTEGLVLGVISGTESAAYPVPVVAYHHIVNDRLAGEPFVVTY